MRVSHLASRLLDRRYSFDRISSRSTAVRFRRTSGPEKRQRDAIIAMARSISSTDSSCPAGM
ncbi:hypothetical protein PDIG_53140 [Penicillium digitatum PHI26]|uniref:Uncharacterized protein n=2 Tax=Penicillium digitatum TaxID=36651 RepID=K9GC30_PEND2|nr:hypothetical protein PDIP_48360 [Penicillium digitatum Pd1]EKV10826.1 hypothetical protein PDIG_53140 [Penicillium digitatum PHI26]EKV13343.1 hypothetical protein PDIP_48360 [Penicillium digitatum Pd1]